MYKFRTRVTIPTMLYVSKLCGMILEQRLEHTRKCGIVQKDKKIE